MNRFHQLKLIVTMATAMGLYLSACRGGETDKPTKEENKSSKSKPLAKVERQIAFLGVLVEELSPAIVSHLPDVVSAEQGVLVHEVSDDSPAAKAGIKLHDILVTYDDQKLFAPEQLFKLVRSDKPGREVTLGLIRAGKAESIKVELGTRSVSITEPSAKRSTSPLARGFHLPGRTRRGETGTPPSAAERSGWNSFDSMTLKKLDKDRFHASIKHTDKDGKLQEHEFEGTREEIHKQIEEDEDLTPNERTHLLRSLDLEGSGIPIWIFPEEDTLGF